jgi:hypothetical protein
MPNEGSINSVIAHIQGLDDSELASSLRIYLKEGVLADGLVFPSRDRHIFVRVLFDHCDTILQERLRRVFAHLLERFEGSNPKDDSAYLFDLVSLASAIRSSQSKERLRRWIRQGIFETWTHEIFNLNNELILASSSYDSDDEWVDFLLNILPKRTSFKDSALAVYRALWQSRGVECLSILPEVLLALDFQNGTHIKTLGSLLRLTVEKVQGNSFCSTLGAVLGRMQKPVEELWLIVLRIDEIVEHELAAYKVELGPLTAQLLKMWYGAISTWQNLPPADRYKAFDKLFEVPAKDRQNIRITSPRVRAAFMFRKKYVIEVASDDQYMFEQCDPFFDEIDNDEEPVYMVAQA